MCTQFGIREQIRGFVKLMEMCGAREMLKVIRNLEMIQFVRFPFNAMITVVIVLFQVNFRW